jgi:hypothetical protein
VGGAPGAAKTSLGVNALVRAATIGHPAVMLAADEDVDDILIRVGQLHGISRELLEKADEQALTQLCEVLAKLPNMAIFDGDETTVEQSLDWLDAHAQPGVPGVFVGDSVQTMHTARSKELETRQRIDDVMQTIKSRTRTGKLVSIVTSEINRAFYRNVRQLEDLNDLAAFKESGGIEYAAKTAMVMRSVPDSEDLFDVGMAKNRGGKKRVLRLQLDQNTTLMTEVAIPEQAPQPSASSKRFSKSTECVFGVIAKCPGIGSTKLRDKTPGIGVATLRQAIEALLDAGRIVNRPTKHGKREDAHYFAVETKPENPEHWQDSDVGDE